MMVSMPEVAGTYPVTPVGSLLNPHQITSVVAVPVAEVVTTVSQVAEEIALVPIAEVPLAMVCAEVTGKSPCAIALKVPMNPVAEACSTWVTVVLEFEEPISVVVTAGTVIVPEAVAVAWMHVEPEVSPAMQY